MTRSPRTTGCGSAGVCLKMGLNRHGLAFGFGLGLDEKLPAGVHIHYFAFKRNQIIALSCPPESTPRNGWPPPDQPVQIGIPLRPSIGRIPRRTMSLGRHTRPLSITGCRWANQCCRTMVKVRSPSDVTRCPRGFSSPICRSMPSDGLGQLRTTEHNHRGVVHPNRSITREPDAPWPSLRTFPRCTGPCFRA